MKINEMFYSLQGEGRWAGHAAVFIRLAGCNLSCPFCDTQHQAYAEANEAEIAERAAAYGCPMVIITGGEPMMQLNIELIRQLRARGFSRIHVETNGSVDPGAEVLQALDWITVSPKAREVVIPLERISEVKIVYPAFASLIERWQQAEGPMLFLQPCHVQGDADASAANLRATIAYVLQHPQWALSVQLHRMIGIE